MYRYKNGLLHNSFNDMFLLNCDVHVHSYNTRSKNFFRLPYWRTNVRKFSLRFQGPKIFNSLSPEIQNASSNALFNSKLKSFSWYKHTLALIMLVCSSLLLSLFFSHLFLHYFFSPLISFSFLHLHIQPFLFLSYLMTIFHVPNKFCVLRVKLPMSVL